MWISKRQYNDYEYLLGLWGTTKTLSEDEYQEYQEYKKGLDSHCCQLETPVTSMDFPECQTTPMESVYDNLDELWDNIEEIEDDVGGLVLTQETLEDRLDDLEGDIRTFITDMNESDYAMVKFIGGQRINNAHFLTMIEGLVDGVEELFRIVKQSGTGKEDVQPKSGKGTKRSPKKPVEKDTRK
jgi:hypothetical protein